MKKRSITFNNKKELQTFIDTLPNGSYSMNYTSNADGSITGKTTWAMKISEREIEKVHRLYVERLLRRIYLLTLCILVVSVIGLFV